MKFYDINGTEICKEQFVKIYGDSYFIGNKRIVNGVGQNSRYAEEEIEKVLKYGIKTPIDVVHILAWKTGKIKHYESEKKREFVYAKDWSNAETSGKVLRPRIGECDINKISSYISKNIESLEKEVSEAPQNVLCKLREQSVKGIGTVYLITLMYFISRGSYPIYDRFAKKAIDAIVNEVKPGGVIKERQLPDKTSEKFCKIMKNEMKEYMCNLEAVFGSDYKDRDVDRALWVYGHMFKK